MLTNLLTFFSGAFILSGMKTAIYIRVSTEEQAESGLGLAAQEARCRALATAKGWEIAGVYREEGVSGTLDPRVRPEASRLLADAAAGLFGAILVLKLDRLARRAEWIHRTLRELEGMGVGLTSVSEPVDTSSAMGKAFIGISAVFAELERNLIAERTSQALAAKRAKGEKFGAPPLGVRHADGKAHEISEERATVERIAELRAEGLSLAAIAEQLTAEGRSTKRGGRWASATVFYVVRRMGRESLAA